MDKQIIEVFDQHLKDIVFDKAFFSKIAKFRINWVYKNPSNMEFLGSNLLGVHPIRFSALDVESFFMELLNVDEEELRYEIHALKDIDIKRKVSSNIVFLTLTYLMHKFTTSLKIGKDRDAAVKEVYYIFAYKAMSSLVSHYFKYPVDTAIAVAVHEQLNNKFLIKRLKNWQEVFEYRADDVLDKGLHSKRIKYYKQTDDATRVVIDLQGRLRDMIKNIYIVIINVNETNSKVTSTTLDDTDLEGDATIKSIVDRPDVYIMYIKNIIYKHNDFIKDDLLHVISDLLDMNNSKDLYKTLTYMSDNYMASKDMDFVIDKTIDLSIEYLSKNNISDNYNNDLKNVIIMLKNYYTGSRVDNKDVDKLKKKIKKIFIDATGRTNKTKISNNRVGVILYIFLRAIAKNNYK